MVSVLVCTVQLRRFRAGFIGLSRCRLYRPGTENVTYCYTFRLPDSGAKGGRIKASVLPGVRPLGPARIPAGHAPVARAGACTQKHPATVTGLASRCLSGEARPIRCGCEVWPPVARPHSTATSRMPRRESPPAPCAEPSAALKVEPCDSGNVRLVVALIIGPPKVPSAFRVSTIRQGVTRLGVTGRGHRSCCPKHQRRSDRPRAGLSTYFLSSGTSCSRLEVS
jgi:hypothetical protein